MASPNVAASALFNVNGLVAVVTGGGTGTGLMIAKALAPNGTRRVYIVGRKANILHEAARSIDQDVVVPLPGDVTSKDSHFEMAERVEAEYQAHVLEAPMEDFTQTYAVNTTAVNHIALAFLNLLDAGNNKGNMGPDWRSQIVATSSIGGFSRLKGASFAYNSSKAAVMHMIKMMATAFVPYKIRCNVLAPGIFPSDLAGGTIANLGPGHGGVFEPSFIPAERPGNEEDIARPILYLTSRAGAYLNGSVIVVDGGRLGTLVSTY
ncbi:NAD(P)-binding protein [Lentithecium fluviatile CBS 122367]|uniref:NAD(P)-binding protein n=1 Tax=Lentithecium fluviatile CBS 122367 TaxID=1168545 RepID=A0A6G1INA7_9PLEO|nr:NAD(P)-binding protein [Lentithecium fluviatile CBS 122367]